MKMSLYGHIFSLWGNDTEREDEFLGRIDDVYYLLRGSFSNQNVLFLIKYDNFHKHPTFSIFLHESTIFYYFLHLAHQNA